MPKHTSMHKKDQVFCEPFRKQQSQDNNIYFATQNCTVVEIPASQLNTSVLLEVSVLIPTLVDHVMSQLYTLGCCLQVTSVSGLVLTFWPQIGLMINTTSSNTPNTRPYSAAVAPFFSACVHIELFTVIPNLQNYSNSLKVFFV